MSILLLPFILIGQKCNDKLSGKVLDFHNKTPLVGATLVISDMNVSVFTDLNGQYVFKDICSGEYEIEVMHPDCRTLIFPVRISGDTEKDFFLEHHLEELDEVQVVGGAVLKKTNSGIEERLDNETLIRYSGGSLGDALNEISGVSSLNTGATIVKPVIHGLNGSRVLVLNDGVRMQDMEWGDEHAPNVDINSASAISVVKGAAALQYGGDAVGGVILMEQEIMPAKDTLYGKTILNGMSNGRGGSISSELSKVFENQWFAKVQGSYKRLGDQEAPDYILSNTGIRETGISLQAGKKTFNWGIDARFSYYDAEIAILRASHIGNVDDLIRSINSGTPQIIRPFTYDLQNPRQQVTHYLGKIALYKRFQGLGKWSLQYDFQDNRRLEFDVRRGELDDRASLDLQLTTHTINTDFKWDANDRLEMQLGLMGRYQDNFPNPDTGVRRLIPDYEKFDLGIFSIAEYRISQDWNLDAGFRYDFSRIDATKFYLTSRWEERGYDEDFSDIIIEDLDTQLLTNPVLDFNNFSGTTGVKYNKDNNTFFRLNYALAQRAPNPSELFSDGLHHSAARIELGDLRINSETSSKISLSYEKRNTNWGFTLEPYANFVSDFVVLEPTGVEFTIRGAFPVWSYRQTDSRLIGLDASAYVDWSDRWETDHQFSIVKGKDTENDIALINIPAANFRNRIRFVKREWNGLEVALMSNLVFRQNEFPPNIVVFSPEEQQDVLLEINTPPDAYHLLSFTSKMDFSLGDSAALTASVNVNNLFDTSFRDYLNRQRFFANGMGRNIQLQLIFNY
ncbi:TonB-dependent receptor [Muriicola sp. SD30]|uniref:TonB-dependent receptor n=1 Tax=Muriicola sp. SD30 TaxID=3240936 RepID=UPI00350E920E